MNSKSTKNKRLMKPIKVYGSKRSAQNGNDQTNWKKPKTDESEILGLINMNNTDEFMAYVESQLGKDWESEMKFKPGYIRKMLLEGGTEFKSLLLSNLLPRMKQQQQQTEEKLHEKQIPKQPILIMKKVMNPGPSRNSNVVEAVHKKPVQAPAQTKGSKREFYCTIAGCSASFQSLPLLQHHLKTFNHEIYRSPDGWFSCPRPNCLRKCNSIGALKSHLSAFHKEPSSIANISFPKSTNTTTTTVPSFKYPSANPLTFRVNNPEILLQQVAGINPEEWRALELERQKLKQLVAEKKNSSSSSSQNLNQDNNNLLHQKELEKMALKLLSGNMD